MDEPISGRANWFEGAWHYVSLGYRGEPIGILVDCDDEGGARREAEEFCISIGAAAKVLAVRKVVSRELKGAGRAD